MQLSGFNGLSQGLAWSEDVALPDELIE